MSFYLLNLSEVLLITRLSVCVLSLQIILLLLF